MSHIQAVLFDNKEWDTAHCRKWLSEHDYEPIKRVHKTTNNYRYRLSEPKSNYRYRTKHIGDGITLILGYKNKH